MDVRRLPELGRDAELLGVGTDPRAGRLHRLLHDVAELTGQGQGALALHPRGLDDQDVAADRCPCQADRDTRDPRALLDLLELEARHAEVRRDHIGRDPRRLRVPFRAPPRYLAADAGDLALEIPHPGLTGVAAGQQAERLGHARDVRGWIESVIPSILATCG